MELCKGGDLEGLLQDRGRLTEAEAACCMKPIFEFLKACHKESICFGDVKPSNFMLLNADGSDSTMNMKAIDFGCSQRILDGVPLQIRMGTPIFFAPEVFRKWYGVEADCWSTGIMMYLMLSGSFPFWDEEDLVDLTPQDVMKRVITDEIEYPPEIWDNLSPEVNSLVRGLLDKNKSERITARGALEHPWFERFVPNREAARVLNNVVLKGMRERAIQAEV
mmetsp:Transcript_35022/g.83049  ORF Transcript_35022/g.83049 Transcript_35022/m.83049 type:complete len:221 (+) Transcript_35022:88-750(+)